MGPFPAKPCRTGHPIGFLFIYSFLGALLLGQNPTSAQSAKQDADVITRTLTFEAPLLDEREMPGTPFTAIRLPGTISMARHPGEPALPVTFVQVLLPPRKAVVKVSVHGQLRSLDTGAFDLKESPLLPYQPPLPIGAEPPDEPVIDKTLYQSESPFPSNHHDAPRVGYCRGYAICSVALHPVKYIPAEGRLFYFSEMRLRIELEDAEDIHPCFRNRTSDEHWVGRMVSNPAMRSQYRTASLARQTYPGGLCDPSEHYDYVIITTEKNGLDYWAKGGTTPHNWESLMERHKNLDGLDCTRITIQAILAESDYQNPDPLFNDAPARIREFCRDAYLDWGTSYILIGGDADLIPARLMDCAYEEKVDADMYWSHLDGTFNDDHDKQWGEEEDTGFDLYGELFIGRIPCDVPQDVSNWLTKSFYYADAKDPDYLDNGAFFGGDLGYIIEGDDMVDYGAIKGTDDWLGLKPWKLIPYPSWAGFQYGFETWNEEHPGAPFDLSQKWTGEPPNPGWMGGLPKIAIQGLRDAIDQDECTLICGCAHGNPWWSLSVGGGGWMAYQNTKPFLLYDMGCHCGDMDATDDGVLEVMLFHSDTSLAFTCIYNTGFGWAGYLHTGSSSSLHMKSFWDYLFNVNRHSGHTANWQLGRAMAHARDMLAPALDWNFSFRNVVHGCHLFGDPAQRLKPPEEPALFVSIPEGLPEGPLPPGPETCFTVRIRPGVENPVPGSCFLHYRFDPGDPFIRLPIAPLGGELYEAAVPCTAPGDQPEFYISALGDRGTAVCSPWNAPAGCYAFDVHFVEELFHDDFETDKGWTVENLNLQDGAWERGVPQGNGAWGDPLWDWDGSGKCFVTGNAYQSDVDGGPTRLVSPRIDLASGDAEIRYGRWHFAGNNDDVFTVEVSNDDGMTWSQVEQVKATVCWNPHAFHAAEFVNPTGQVRVRFSAADQPDNGYTEAGLDGFTVRRILHDAALWAEAYALPVSQGGVVAIHMDAGPDHGGLPYLLLGSASGTSPGTPLPGGSCLPLNWDHLTRCVLAALNGRVFQNFKGNLDGTGCAQATLDTQGPLDPSLAGMSMHFAFLLDPAPYFVSNAITVTLTP